MACLWPLATFELIINLKSAKALSLTISEGRSTCAPTRWSQGHCHSSGEDDQTSPWRRPLAVTTKN